ncbi:MAG: hypothetical protein IJV67_02980, partial [Clostridia bacterium]|nr:hypothetical protein [Clostridia bacterium]
PLNITVVSLGALNGDCDWTVTEIKKLPAAPGEEAQGYKSPVNDKAAEVKITAEATYVATTDSVVKAVENLNEKYVAITMKHTADSSYYAMGINILGTTDNGWTAGLVLAMTKDGHYFRVGGVNNSNLVQLNFYSMGNGAEITVAYRLTYIMADGVCTHVQVELWQGTAGNLAKVAPHGDTLYGEKWAYNTDIGAFVFDYNIVEEAQFAPDCTLIAMQAFNDKDVDCDWTVTKVEVGNKPLANVINGMGNEVSVPANYDAHATAVSGLTDEFVVVDFERTAGKNFALGVNIFGTAENCWLGGIMFRIAHDGIYLKHSNVNGETVCQLNQYSLEGINRFVYRITDAIVDGKTYKKVEVWAGSKDGAMNKVGLHAISAGMDAFVSFNQDEVAFYFDVAAIQGAGLPTTNDCSLQLPAALNTECAWTLKVSVTNDESIVNKK